MGVHTQTMVLSGWRTDQDCRDELNDADIDYVAFDPMIAGTPVFVGKVLAEFDEYADGIVIPIPTAPPDPGPRPPVGDEWTPGVWFIGHYV